MTVGLGPDEKMTEMDIDWPIGIKEVLHDLAANSIYVIRVGQGIEKRVPLPPSLERNRRAPSRHK